MVRMSDHEREVVGFRQSCGEPGDSDKKLESSKVETGGERNEVRESARGRPSPTLAVARMGHPALIAVGRPARMGRSTHPPAFVSRVV